jgi:predicted RNA-binding protein with PUA-like domain
MSPRYWLFKSEPSTYSFDDLVRDGVTHWDGVRNFQARNFIRDDIRAGDGVLFYHSSADPLAVVGTATVAKAGYPDATAWDPKSAHPDPKSTPGNPIWYMVDIKAGQRFARPVTMEESRAVPALKDMLLLKRGMRLSIQPVTPEEWATVCKMGGIKP